MQAKRTDLGRRCVAPCYACRNHAPADNTGCKKLAMRSSSSFATVQLCATIVLCRQTPGDASMISSQCFMRENGPVAGTALRRQPRIIDKSSL